MLKSDLATKLLRYGVVGGTVMAVFTVLNWLLAPHFGKQPAFLISYVPAVALHFSLNKWWTFGCSRTDTHRQVGEYLVMVGVTFVIQWAVFTALVTWTALPSWFAAGAANAAQMVITFVVMQRRVFAAPSAP